MCLNNTNSEVSKLFYHFIYLVFLTGIPDPPSELDILLNDYSLMTTWDYRIIPTIFVDFTITLTFLSPSQLKDITVYVTDTDSYNFTLEGVRSCDPFTICITSTNIVGQSPPSCVYKTLPYIPSTNDIDYSLLRIGDSYSLNLTIKVLIYFFNFIHSFMGTCCNMTSQSVKAD